MKGKMALVFGYPRDQNPGYYIIFVDRHPKQLTMSARRSCF